MVTSVLHESGFTALEKLTENRKACILTDENVFRLYGDKFPGLPRMVLKPGEKSKTMENVMKLIRHCDKNGLDRSSLIIGIGGGVVTDMAGFTAGIYLRGIPCGYVPTTLLAQVDAAAGGKTAVNFNGAKNHIGLFRKPEFIIYLPHVLATLSKKELLSGYGEILKHALISGENFFTLFEKDSPGYPVNTEFIERSRKLKNTVVAEDFHENSSRKKLNLGHTMGHVFELLCENLTHGEAVALGILFSVRFSEIRYGKESSLSKKVRSILIRYGFDYKIPRLPYENVRELLFQDKKRKNSHISFVFVDTPGKIFCENISVDEIVSVYKKLCGKEGK
ncbi:MAG: 3-dehydroquinate synthase family protein [bacterium]